jgi:hypothetical protein
MAPLEGGTIVGRVARAQTAETTLGAQPSIFEGGASDFLRSLQSNYFDISRGF